MWPAGDGDLPPEHRPPARGPRGPRGPRTLGLGRAVLALEPQAEGNSRARLPWTALTSHLPSCPHPSLTWLHLLFCSQRRRGPPWTPAQLWPPSPHPVWLRPHHSKVAAAWDLAQPPSQGGSSGSKEATPGPESVPTRTPTPGPQGAPGLLRPGLCSQGQAGTAWAVGVPGRVWGHPGDLQGMLLGRRFCLRTGGATMRTRGRGGRPPSHPLGRRVRNHSVFSPAACAHSSASS